MTKTFILVFGALDLFGVSCLPAGRGACYLNYYDISTYNFSIHLLRIFGDLANFYFNRGLPYA